MKKKFEIFYENIEDVNVDTLVDKVINIHLHQLNKSVDVCPYTFLKKKATGLSLTEVILSSEPQGKVWGQRAGSSMEKSGSCIRGQPRIQINSRTEKIHAVNYEYFVKAFSCPCPTAVHRDAEKV